MYKLSVQLVDFRHDQVEERGEVDAHEAVTSFRAFSFKEQLERAKSLPAPTFPTVSFRSEGDGAVLAIWSLEPDEYEVYLETGGKKVTVEETAADVIEEIIRDFFGGEREGLLERLSRSAGATIASEGGLLGRLKGLFGLASQSEGLASSFLNFFRQ